MESENELVYLVNDDSRVREERSALLRANGTNVQAFNWSSQSLSILHHRIHRANASPPHHEKNAGGFICDSCQASKQTPTRNFVDNHVRCLTPTPNLCETPWPGGKKCSRLRFEPLP
jgi:hypothetical protein